MNLIPLLLLPLLLKSGGKKPGGLPLDTLTQALKVAGDLKESGMLDLLTNGSGNPLSAVLSGKIPAETLLTLLSDLQGFGSPAGKSAPDSAAPVFAEGSEMNRTFLRLLNETERV